MINVTINNRSFVQQMANSQDALIRKAEILVRQISNDIKNNAKSYAPTRTGRLKNSIRVYAGSSKLQAEVRTSVKYAKYVEYGTGIYLHGGGGRQTPWRYYNRAIRTYFWTRGQKPQFFMRRGFETSTQASNLERIAKGVFRWV